MLVRFNTKGMRGRVQRRIVVYSNDMEHNAVSFSIVADIQPELQIKPTRFEIVRPSSAGERHLELEVMNLSDRELEQFSVRTTVESMKPLGKVPGSLATGERFAQNFSIKFPPCGDEDSNIRSGYIIVEAYGHARTRVRIPVLIQDAPQ